MKITSGGATIDGNNITATQEATSTDLDNALSKYIGEIGKDGITTQENSDITRLLGNASSIRNYIESHTPPATAPASPNIPPTQGSAAPPTPPASPTLAPTTDAAAPKTRPDSINLAPAKPDPSASYKANDGTLFNGLNDGTIANELQYRYTATQTDPNKWTQKEVDDVESFLKANGVTNPPTQEQKEKIKEKLNIATTPKAEEPKPEAPKPEDKPKEANKAKEPEKPKDEPKPEDKPKEPEKPKEADKPKEEAKPEEKDPIKPQQIEYMKGNGQTGKVYSGLAGEERKAFDTQLAKCKTQEEAVGLFNKLTNADKDKDGKISGFDATLDKDGYHQVDSYESDDTEAKAFLKDVLGENPTYAKK